MKSQIKQFKESWSYVANGKMFEFTQKLVFKITFGTVE